MAESKSAALPLGYTPPVPCLWWVLRGFATVLGLALWFSHSGGLEKSGRRRTAKLLRPREQRESDKQQHREHERTEVRCRDVLPRPCADPHAEQRRRNR